MVHPSKTAFIILLGVSLLLSACEGNFSPDPTPASLSILPGRETQTAGPTRTPPAPAAPTVTAIPAPSVTPTSLLMPRPVPSPPPLLSVSETDSDAANSADPPEAEVIVVALNVRSGPGLAYPPIAALKAGDRVTVLGRNEASGWLRVNLSKQDSGWISESQKYVRMVGSTDDLPLVEAPPLPSSPPPDVSRASDATRPKGALSGKLIFMTGSGGQLSVINVDGSGLRRLTGGVIDPVVGYGSI